MSENETRCLSHALAHDGAFGTRDSRERSLQWVHVGKLVETKRSTVWFLQRRSRIAVFVGAVVMTGLAMVGCGSAAAPTEAAPKTNAKPTDPTKRADAGALGPVAPPSQTPPPPRTTDGGVAPNQLIVTTVTPPSATTTQGNATITVAGSGFVSGAKITLAGQEIPTQFVSATSLTGTLAGTTLAGLQPGAASLAVRNGALGQSNAVVFTVSAGHIAVTQLSPASVPAGNAAIALQLTETGFVQGMNVSFNGVPFTGAVTGGTSIAAQIPATSLATPGDVQVSVQGAGVASPPRTFSITSVTPVLTTITPSTASVGAESLAVTITGSGFKTGSTRVVASWSVDAPNYVRYELAQPATVISSTQIQAVLSSAWLTRDAYVYLELYDTASNPVRYSTDYGTIHVTDSGAVTAPQVSSIAPDMVAAGTAGLTATVFGSGFSRRNGRGASATRIIRRPRQAGSMFAPRGSTSSSRPKSSRAQERTPSHRTTK